MYIISLLFALLSGLLISTQGVINSVGSKLIGTPSMIVWLSLVQAVPPLILLLFRQQQMGWGQALSHGFKWYIASGIIGIVILTVFSFSISTIGASSAFVIAVLGQIIGSAIADQFGLFGTPVRSINPLRIVSIAVIVVGVLLLLKSNQTTEAVETTSKSNVMLEKQSKQIYHDIMKS